MAAAAVKLAGRIFPSLAEQKVLLIGVGEMIELPVKPPMLTEGSLAVTRERRLVLVAVARQGLSDLRMVGEAYRWMSENRALIAMSYGSRLRTNISAMMRPCGSLGSIPING